MDDRKLPEGIEYDGEVYWSTCPECGHQQGDMGNGIGCDECGHKMPTMENEYCGGPCPKCGSVNVFICKEGWECQDCGEEGDN